MKKLVLIFFSGLLLLSCGRNKKEESDETLNAKLNKITLLIDGVYEKDDSIVVYKKVGGFFLYDMPISYKLKGSALIQRILIEIPGGENASNFSIVASTNKLQEHLTLKNISVKSNDSLVFDGDNFKHSDYFMADQSFIWDPKLLRCNLVHTNKYPPGLVGNEKLEEILSK
jgi:hypothetical protein